MRYRELQRVQSFKIVAKMLRSGFERSKYDSYNKNEAQHITFSKAIKAITVRF